MSTPSSSGPGVIGLSVGVELAERGLGVHVLTRRDPLETTSATASAMIGPSFSPADSPTGRLERAGIEQFTALADTPGSGVALRSGRLASRQSVPPLPGLTPYTPDELPPGMAAAWRTTVPLVDMHVYLAYLVQRLQAAGGHIVQREVSSLAEVAGEAALIANCAGLGARELVPDPAMRAVRGQHVIVDNPGLDEFFVEEPFRPAFTAYWPYPDHVVLGGTRADGDENLEPDPVLAEQILERCRAIEPRLARAAVLSHQVGLRPARDTMRLEFDQLDGARCVHNYGHDGSGVTLSWGCARETLALLLDQPTLGVAMSVHRIVPDLASSALTDAARFYTNVLGLEPVMDLGWIVTLADPRRPQLQISLMTHDETAPVTPAVSIEVDDVDSAHAAALADGADIVHPLTNEAWGVRRFFVRDPDGHVINILTHL